VLVAEAGLKSGALITANAAGDQGRGIYAVPGRIDRPQYAGSNALIQQGAKLVSCAQDILEDFSLLFREPPNLPAPPEPKDLSAEQKILFSTLGSETLHLDVLAAKVQLPVASVSSLLLQLELAGVVKQLPGKRFVKIL
jgi:DNA processing protein